MITADAITWNIDQNGTPHPIDGTPTGTVEHIHPGAFYISNYDPGNMRIDFNGAYESFTINNILAAKSWIESDGTFYSANGYTWSDAAGLSENINVLWSWNAHPYPATGIPFASSPNFAAAGAHDGELYWVELNTGWLFEFDIALDQISFLHRIYEGDGTNQTADNHVDLNPVLVYPDLYVYDQNVYKINVETGLTELMFVGFAEVERW